MFDVRIRSALAVSATALLLSAPVLAQQQPEPPLDQQAEQPADQQPDQPLDQQAEQPADQEPDQQQTAEQPEGIPEALGAPIHLSADDVRAVQEALQQAGHEPGDPDGLWGEQSRSAMRDFQEAEGLPVSGNIDMASIRALQLWDIIMSAEGAPRQETEPGDVTEVDADAEVDAAAPDPAAGPMDDAAAEDTQDVAEPEDEEDPEN
jgi:peptidoglycan hydrolase-like protein with peptidoglycan-binding domain